MDSQVQLERIHDRVELAETRIVGKIAETIEPQVKLVKMLTSLVKWLVIAIMAMQSPDLVKLAVEVLHRV